MDKKSTSHVYSKLTFAEASAPEQKPRNLFLRSPRDFFRAAHNSIFFFHPNTNLTGLRLPHTDFHRNLARFALGHTVKELASRGLKSRSGDVPFRDLPRPTGCLSRLRLSRRRAETTPPHQHTSTRFERFFQGFLKRIPNPWKQGIWRPYQGVIHRLKKLN